jgi:MATE family multidrug resistance protein
LAAHQIAITCAATTFMVPLGIGQAVSVRVGQARGAGRLGEIRTIVHGTLGMTLGIAVLFAMVYLTLGSWIAGWFTVDPAVKVLTAQLLVFAGIFQVFDCIQIASSGALRGFGDTKVPFLFGILAYWVVALPVSHLAAFQFGFGAPGIWIGLVVGLGVAALALTTRLLAKCSAHPETPR